MAAYILESAYRYAHAADLLSQDGGLGVQSEVMAALAMEMLLKSLYAEPVDNERKGTMLQQYKVVLPKRLEGKGSINGHDLYALFEHLPSSHPLKDYIRAYADLLDAKRAVFTEARYPYEPSGNKGFSDELLEAVVALLPRFVRYARENEPDDIWLQAFQEMPELFEPVMRRKDRLLQAIFDGIANPL